MDKERVKNVVKLMTLSEKVRLTSIESDLRGTPLPRLKVPSVRLPHEFSPAMDCVSLIGALGHTFDTELARDFGKWRTRQALVLGESFGAAVPLGVVRNPFDESMSRAFSDDPIACSALASGFSSGCALSGIGYDILGVGGFERYIGARALNEIYMKPFNDNRESLGGVAVPTGKLDGVPVGENRGFMKSLTDGFDGIVFSESGGSVDKAEEVSCGACLGICCTDSDAQRLNNAVANGLLYERKLDACVERTVYAAAVSYETVKGMSAADMDDIRPDGLLKRLCDESAVLLKNDGALPIGKGERVISFGDGCAVKLKNVTPKKAAKLAKKADEAEKAVIYLKNADSFDTAALNALIDALSERAKVILVLSARRYFTLPQSEKVNALVFAPCDLKETADSLKRLLAGETDFTGRLSCCWAHEEADYPFAAFKNRDFYVGESVYSGSRYFKKSGFAPQFDFGFGLSYNGARITDFAVKEKSDGLYFEFSASSASGKEAASTAIVTCALDGDELGISGRTVAFSRIELEGEPQKYCVKAHRGVFDVFDAESGELKRIGGKYTFELNIAGSRMTAEKKVKGAKADEKKAPYFVTGEGRVIFDETEVEKEVGAPIGGTDGLIDINAVKKAEKTIAAAKKRNKESSLFGFCGKTTDRMSPSARIKTARYLKR